MSKLWRKTLRNAENWSGLASHKGKKKHLFTIEFKTQVVSYAEERSDRSVVSHYVVEHKAVREWKKDIKKIKATQTRRQRFEGGGRKWKAEEIEDELVHCIYKKKSSTWVGKWSSGKQRTYLTKERRSCDLWLVCCQSKQVWKVMRKHGLSLRRKKHNWSKIPILHNQ